MQFNEPILIDVMTFCRLTGCGRTKTYELIRDNRISSIKIGRSRRIFLASVKQLLALSADGRETTPRASLPCNPIDEPI